MLYLKISEITNIEAYQDINKLKNYGQLRDSGNSLFLWGSSKSTMLQWMAHIQERMGSTNWSWWAIKNKIKSKRTRHWEGGWQRLGGGVRHKYDQLYKILKG